MSKLPNGWKKARIGEVASIKSGYAFKSENFISNGVPIIRIGNLDGNTVTIDKSICYPENFLLQNKQYEVKYGDILIAMSGATTGKIGLHEEKKVCLLNQRVGKFDLDNDKIHKKFLFYILKSDLVKRNIAMLASGCAQPNISNKQIESIEVFLPPIEQQKKIASILEKAESALQKRKEVDQLVDRYLQSVFIEVFGDPSINPKGWDCLVLNDLVEEFRYGTSNKCSKKGYPTLRIPNVVNNKIDLQDLKHCQVSDQEFKKLRLEEGDVLFVRSNGNQDYAGRSAICSKDTEGFIFASYLIRAKLKKDRLNPIFLHNYLNTSYGKMQLKSKTKTSAGQYNINTEGLGSLFIALPPIEVQNKFVQIVNKVQRLKQKQKQSAEELAALFKSLMQKAFRGELTTDDDDIIEMSIFSTEGFKKLIKAEFKNKEFTYEELSSAVSTQYKNILYEEIKLALFACLEKPKSECTPFLLQVFDKKSEKVYYKIN